MSKYYAKFKETENEIIVFATKQERDDWVNFKDEFSVTNGCTSENSSFERMPLTTKEATYIIKSKGLTLYYDKDSFGVAREIYIPRSTSRGWRTSTKTNKTEVENNNMMKINRKVKLTPDYGLVERKPMAALVMQNATIIGTKKFAWIDVSLLNIPPYQRERRNHVYKIAGNWDADNIDN